MELIFKKNSLEISAANIAYLKDRILVNEGKQQLFGNQFYTDKKGIFKHRPTRDFKNVDRRRKEYNLPPFSVNKKLVSSYKVVPIKKNIK
jgi:hypothetical protein